jgi:hypothetical protein
VLPASVDDFSARQIFARYRALADIERAVAS